MFNHTPDEIGIPANDLLNVPAEAAIVLRRMVLGDNSIDEDTKQFTARFLPVHPEEIDGTQESDRLRTRLYAKVQELHGLPQHFILNDRLWPRQPHSIQKNMH